MSRQCPECSSRIEFGFRPKESFKNCICKIDSAKICRDFLKWMKHFDLMKDDRYGNLTFDKIRKKVDLISPIVFQEKMVEKSLINLVVKLQDEIPFRLNPWEYVAVGVGNGNVVQDIAYDLEVMLIGYDTIDNRTHPYQLEDMEDFNLFSPDRGDSINVSTNDTMIVTCFDFLSRVKNPEFVLREIYRILAPGGIMVLRDFDCPNWERAYTFDFFNKVIPQSNTITSYRSKHSWEKLVKEIGFEMSQVEAFDQDFTHFTSVFQK